MYITSYSSLQLGEIILLCHLIRQVITVTLQVKNGKCALCNGCSFHHRDYESKNVM
jgi:hypothetical protein